MDIGAPGTLGPACRGRSAAAGGRLDVSEPLILLRFTASRPVPSSGGGGTGGDAGVIDLDQISVGVSTATIVPMLDDGQHHDGAAGDGAYRARNPGHRPRATR